MTMKWKMMTTIIYITMVLCMISQVFSISETSVFRSNRQLQDNNSILLRYGQKIVSYSSPDNLINEIVPDVECENTCGECSPSLLDPISGDLITSSSFSYICLTHGRKIYFASIYLKQHYLSMLHNNSKYMMQEVSSIPTITVNEFASGHHHETLSDDEDDLILTVPTGDHSDINHSSGAHSSTSSNGFCASGGSSMLNGFQTSWGSDCVFLFIPTFLLNSIGKYILGAVGCFLLAFTYEKIMSYRGEIHTQLLSSTSSYYRASVGSRLLLAAMYMVQMMIAYLAMLVVMTYEIGLCTTLIVGFGAGYMCFHNFDVFIETQDSEKVVRELMSSPNTIAVQVTGMLCDINCASLVESTLLELPGVNQVHGDFNTRMFYISGNVTREKVIAKIKSVGFGVVETNRLSQLQNHYTNSSSNNIYLQ